MKIDYTAPKLVKVGSFETITQSTTNGAKTDMAFPSGTPLTTILQSLS